MFLLIAFICGVCLEYYYKLGDRAKLLYDKFRGFI